MDKAGGQVKSLKSELFLARLYGEFQEFKANVLSGTDKEIYDRCYEIDAIINLYEILEDMAEKMTDSEIDALISQQGILNGFYDSWLKKEDSHYSELADHVSDEIRVITDRYQSERREARIKITINKIQKAEKKSGAKVNSEVITAREYAEMLTGKYYANVSTYSELRKAIGSQYDNLWDYPLEEISEIMENNLNVTLVRLSKEEDYTEYEYRWFEMPVRQENA